MRSPLRPRGFSLVETVLALGVVAFALVALMGLLPVGLSNFRSAIDASVGAQIYQRVVTDMEQADFHRLVPSGGAGGYFILPIRYFDDQGNEVRVAEDGKPTAEESLRIIYQARVRGTMPGESETGLPGQTRYSPKETTFLVIQIANNPAGVELKEDENQLWDSADARKRGLALTTYSAVVTRNGYSKEEKSL